MTTTTPQVAVPPIADTRRRIKNILDVYPAANWTSDEALNILHTLENIVRERVAR